MEELTLSPFDSHAFFHTVYGHKDHTTLYYGLSNKDPCVPLLFQTFPGTSKSFSPSPTLLRTPQKYGGLITQFVILIISVDPVTLRVDSSPEPETEVRMKLAVALTGSGANVVCLGIRNFVELRI